MTLEVYDALCHTETFLINGVKADEDDFGEIIDREPIYDYGCGDSHFTPMPSKPEVLEKYKINADEYKQICDELEEKLSFGSCGWCV